MGYTKAEQLDAVNRFLNFFYICSFFFGRGGGVKRETRVQTKPEPNKCKRTSKQRKDFVWKFTYLPSLVALQYANEQKIKIYGELCLGVHLSKYSSAAVNCLTLTLLVIRVHSFQCQIILGHSLSHWVRSETHVIFTRGHVFDSSNSLSKQLTDIFFLDCGKNNTLCTGLGKI